MVCGEARQPQVLRLRCAPLRMTRCFGAGSAFAGRGQTQAMIRSVRGTRRKSVILSAAEGSAFLRRKAKRGEKQVLRLRCAPVFAALHSDDPVSWCWLPRSPGAPNAAMIQSVPQELIEKKNRVILSAAEGPAVDPVFRLDPAPRTYCCTQPDQGRRYSASGRLYAVFRYSRASFSAPCVLSLVCTANLYSLTARSRCPVRSKIFPSAI